MVKTKKDVESELARERFREDLHTAHPPAGERRVMRALLIGTYPFGVTKEASEEYLDELELLCLNLGISAAEKISCPLRAYDSATFLGKGKVEEMCELAAQLKVDLIVLDDDIKPSQQRNLEEIFKLPVLDRTEVILDVFSKGAHTREACLQIELAQVQYQLPRLKRLWTHLSRQRGGGVQLKGPGETQIETDRRILRRRQEKLYEELEEILSHRDTQRQERERTSVPTFAIVGYTNAGKSTLLNALTDAGVLVEDRLFATLDTTTRKFTLPNNQKILLVDTVGFIRKLPHLLVAAFKSTLEESVHADILIHLVDVCHPMAVEHAEATYAVLKELKADKKPIITALNKVDACDSLSMCARMRAKYIKTVPISALNKTGFEDLLELMMKELSHQRRIVKVKIPQSNNALISELTRLGHVFYTEYEENDVIMRVEVPVEMLGRVKPYELSLPV